MSKLNCNSDIVTLLLNTSSPCINLTLHWHKRQCLYDGLQGLLAKIKWWLRQKASVYNVADLGSIPGLGSSLEKETATHSSTLA